MVSPGDVYVWGLHVFAVCVFCFVGVLGSLLFAFASEAKQCLLCCGSDVTPSFPLCLLCCMCRVSLSATRCWNALATGTASSRLSCLRSRPSRHRRATSLRCRCRCCWKHLAGTVPSVVVALGVALHKPRLPQSFGYDAPVVPSRLHIHRRGAPGTVARLTLNPRRQMRPALPLALSQILMLPQMLMLLMLMLMLMLMTSLAAVVITHVLAAPGVQAPLEHELERVVAADVSLPWV